MTPQTGLVSLMLVNNELGTLTDIASISRVVHRAGALLHVDAAQALGRTPIDVDALGIDLLSISAHKVYGPKGVGALYVSRDAFERIAPQMHGGGHERGLRSGTLATHQIVGMGAACELARQEMEEETQRISRLSQQLLEQILAIQGAVHNAASAQRIPHTLSLTFDRTGFFPLLLSEELAVSSTSACNSAAGAVSHVLKAIGLNTEAASRTIRVSLGRFTTRDDIDAAVTSIAKAMGHCGSAAVQVGG
jgi:cysteine desulfurase